MHMWTICAAFSGIYKIEDIVLQYVIVKRAPSIEVSNFIWMSTVWCTLVSLSFFILSYCTYRFLHKHISVGNSFEQDFYLEYTLENVLVLNVYFVYYVYLTVLHKGTVQIVLKKNIQVQIYVVSSPD